MIHGQANGVDQHLQKSDDFCGGFAALFKTL
jgi:hypothetical protein